MARLIRSLSQAPAAIRSELVCSPTAISTRARRRHLLPDKRTRLDVGRGSASRGANHPVSLRSGPVTWPMPCLVEHSRLPVPVEVETRPRRMSPRPSRRRVLSLPSRGQPLRPASTRFRHCWLRRAATRPHELDQPSHRASGHPTRLHQQTSRRVC